VSEDESENNSENPHEDAKETKRIKDMFDKKPKPKKIHDTSNEETIIDFMLDEELKDATKCKNCPKPEEDKGVARSQPPRDPSSPPAGDVRSAETNDTPASEDEDDEDEDEDDVDDNLEEDTEAADKEAASEDTGPEEGSPAEELKEPAKDTTDQEVTPACEIVATLFKDVTTLQAACKQKYDGNNSRLGWKCIPSGNNTTTGGESAEAKRQRRSADSVDTTTTSGATTGGSICIPPRRRKLYVGHLQ
ncbi:hypothetical protein PFTANZ_05874, partial [Plasmodium falciparum Tanzania (2000708)]